MKVRCFIKHWAPLGFLFISAVLRADDVTAPSTSTLTAVTGNAGGKIDLSWASAGNDDTTGDLTGNYRIQYATYSATWDTATTPAGAITTTMTATVVRPGVVQSTTITGLASGTT